MKTQLSEFSSMIESIDSENFNNYLLSFLKQQFEFESAIAFYYDSDSQPSCLFQTNTEAKKNTNILYENGAYLDDPFYQFIESNKDLNIYQLDEIAPKNFANTHYYKSFYHKTGWADETGILLKINARNSVGFFFTQISTSQSCKLNEQETLDALLIIKNLLKIRQRLLIQSNDENQLHYIDNKMVTQELSKDVSLADSVLNHNYEKLTSRELEIVQLILTGLTTNEIAKSLFITTGTIKNHRKNIYKKLNINTQCELFHLLLNK